jgi:AcrR family transcriptional regulator
MSEKIQERREEILECATMLFSASGYRNTDVQLIADKLQIGKGTIYRYFPSKEELFFAAVDRAMLMMEAYIKRQIDGVTSDIERIRLAIRSYIEFYSTNPHLVELFVQERAEFRQRDVTTYLAHRARRDAEWKGIFQRLHADGTMRLSNFDRVIDYVTNGLYGIMFTGVFCLKQPDLTARADEAIDMLLYGIFRRVP